MNRHFKRAIAIYSVTCVLSAAFMLCDHYIFVPLIERTFSYPMWTKIDLFAVRPLFWLSIAALAMEIIFRFLATGAKIKTGKACVAVSLLFLFTYAVFAIIYIVGKLNGVMMNAVLWMTASPMVFIIPGILMAIGTQENESE